MKRQTLVPSDKELTGMLRYSGRTRIPWVGTLTILMFVAVWLTGCATVDPKPFTEFNTLAQKLSRANDVAQTHFDAEKNYWMSRNGGDPREVIGLFLSISDDQNNDRYVYSYSFKDGQEPVFIKWRRFQSGLSDLNLAFIRYTELLAELAGSDLIKQEDFDKLAKDLNSNVRSALLAINPPNPGEDGPNAEKVGLFSTVAAQAAQAYIQSKRKEYLVTIINDNQSAVEAILAHGKKGISNMAGNVRAVYEFNADNVKGKVAASSPDESRVLAESIYAESLVVATTLDLLNSLSDTYDSLATAHRNLAVGLEDGQFSVSSLAANISRVQKLYKELKEANEEAEKKRKEAEKTQAAATP
jgi:hypothetical protein